MFVYEVIAVSDGSTDDGESQVKSFRDSRIKLINQNNRGVSSARNRDIDAVKFELIAFLDADDFYLPGRFRVAKEPFEKYYDVDGVYEATGRGRVFDNIFIERLWRTVKYEEVYLHDYQNVREAREGLSQYFSFYNTERFHSSLGNYTPEEVYVQKRTAF